MAKHKILHTSSRKGCPYDNLRIESFLSILKKEEASLKTYIDSKESFNSLFYISNSVVITNVFTVA